MIGLGLRLRALGRPGHWGTCSFPKKEKHPWAVGHSGTRANARFQKTALGTQALGHLLFSKKKEKHPWAVGHSGKCSFPKNSHGHSGTRALRHSSKNYQKTIKKTIQRLSKRLSVTIYIPKMIVSSVRSSNSHPDLLVTHQHQQHPTFSDNTLVLENNTF